MSDTFDDDEYDDFYDESDDCECIDYDVDIFLGTAWCPRCQRSWGLTDAQLAREIKHQADYMAQFECVEEEADKP